MITFDLVCERIFALTPGIRYVALYRSDDLSMRQAPGVADASTPESDRYEELFVNPALLVLARQRGNAGCGGSRFVLVGYGNFNQLVVPIADGHVSICFDLATDPMVHLEYVETICSSGDLFRVKANDRA